MKRLYMHLATVFSDSFRSEFNYILIVKDVFSRSYNDSDCKLLLLKPPHTADFYIVERPKTEIFVFERQESAVCGRL